MSIWLAVMAILAATPCAATTEAEESAPEAAPAEGTIIDYTVKAGDNLRKIAQDIYGDAKKWVLIRDANPNVDSTNLQPGERLIIPVVQQAEDQWNGFLANMGDLSDLLEWFPAKLSEWTNIQWSREAGQAWTLSLVIAVIVMGLLTAIAWAGMLMWFSTKIVRIPDSTFRRAATCTAVELAVIAAVVAVVAYVAGRAAQSPGLLAAAEFATKLPVLGALAFIADLLVLRSMYHVGIIRSFVLSLSRVAAAAIVIGGLYGICLIVTVGVPRGGV